MKKMLSSLVTNPKISNRLLLVLIVLLMVPVFFVSRALFIGFAQTNDKKEKKITKEQFKNEPIEFIQQKSNGKKFKLNEKFVQEDDWLKNLTIQFKNISDKSIIYADIAIGFPETESTGLRMGMSLEYGVHPRAPKRENNNEVKLLLPGEVGEVNLSPEKLTKLNNFFITRHSPAELTELHLTIVGVFFEDGTYWSAGSMFRPDPDRPGRSIHINDNPKEGNNEKTFFFLFSLYRFIFSNNNSSFLQHGQENFQDRFCTKTTSF